MVVALISNVFPWFKELHCQQCRHFQNRVVGPLSSLMQMDNDHNLDFSRLLMRVARFLWYDGKFADAETFQMHACKSLPVDTDFVAATILAVVHDSNGRLADAVALLEKLLDGEQKALSDGHPNKVATMNHLAMAYRSLREQKKAASLLEDIIELQRRIGVNHNTLSIMNTVALTYRDESEIVKAAALLENVLEIQSRILENGHWDTLITMSNLAITYRDLAKMDRAVVLLENVWEVEETILWP